MKNIIIRKCTRDEIPIVMSINERILPENYPRFFYENVLEKYPECFLVAENRETRELVGYIMFRIERGLDSGLKFLKKGHLVSFAVLKNYQGLGIGLNLLKEGIKRVSRFNVDVYVLEVRVTNYKAINLYKKMGFKILKVIDNYYRDGENAFYMVLKNSTMNIQRF
ncbi:MAG: ribosomal protein S18-alanine N-acetyltransferase [Promethearchaeota archaeon]